MTNDPDELLRQNKALPERHSRLSRALVRISASLDLDTVLREVVDSARAVTGAGIGLITATDEPDRPHRFLTSGIAPEDHRQLAARDDGRQLFEHLRQLPGPLRVSDLGAYVRTLGIDPAVLPGNTLQATPIRHQGVYLGGLVLANKQGGREFADEDEEMLVLFASQAAAAIANARAYRDELRARAKLEALVETSPVGVVLFDAKTGGLVSWNREATRIVEGLKMPDRPIDQLLEIVTSRGADGREVDLTEDPAISEELRRGETLRNEEIVLSVPDGRSVRTLVNVTPIHAADGGVEFVVVTMQDLAPFEELERMRTEFLAIVSHELRTPLTSIKGCAGAVLEASPGFAPAEMLQFFRIINAQADQMSSLVSDLLDAGRIATGTLSVAPEISDIGALVDAARTTFQAAAGRHTVVIDIPLGLPLVMVDRQRISQVLHNLLTNAARRSPESSPIQVSVRRDGTHVAISVSDRGQGIPPDRVPHLFRKHPIMDDAERGLGRGLGLAICKGLVEAHGGRIQATSGGEGWGARFTFTVPVAEEARVDPATASSHERPAGLDRQLPARQRILVVDDDPQTLLFVRDALRAAGYHVLVTGDHREVSRVIRAEKPHLVLLDLMLPGTDGIKLMAEVPELGDRPVIFISAYGRDETIARALGAGAADYVVKPFSSTELTARVRAALRKHAEPEPFVLGELAIDYERRQVTLADDPVRLTATEYEVLRLLSANAGRVLTYRSLLRQAWMRYPDRASPKLVHAVVKRLRRKLGEDAASAAYILNERHVGYRMPAGPDA
ncbi:MAG: response regulator [Chloroflexi bacterium]|nr:response regulator [Chloroflexota bacterium]MDE2805399.1 response regulator [Gemmatimonadota bacterium]